jgi:hypothetical protein
MSYESISVSERAAGLRGFWRDELEQVPKPKWLVDGILQQNSLMLIYGRNQTFKSFLGIDLSLCVATGRDWNGHTVEQGPVAYLISEAPGGYRMRVEAWEKQNVDVPSSMLFTLPDQIDFNRPNEAEALAHRIKQEFSECSPKLVVVDTVAKNFSGDENSAKELGSVVRGMEVIQNRTKAAVLAIHHSTKAFSGARGSSVLEDGVDIAIEMVRKKGVEAAEMKSYKMKDGDPFDTYTLKFMPVPFPDGRSSGVLQVTNRREKVHQPMTQIQKNAASVIKEAGGSADIDQMTKYMGFHKETVRKHLRSLVESGFLIHDFRTVGRARKSVWALAADAQPPKDGASRLAKSD